MADGPRVVCESGKGVRPVRGSLPGQGLRRSQSLPPLTVDLCGMDGEFFDYSKLYLICATHGAAYLPDSGLCVQGPCPGKRLKPVPVEECGGLVLLVKETQHV